MKKRKFIYDYLHGVEPLQVSADERQIEELAASQVFPTFLHNALFAPPITIPHDDCPFRQYIILDEPHGKGKKRANI